jgi:hypothetical protein
LAEIVVFIILSVLSFAAFFCIAANNSAFKILVDTAWGEAVYFWFCRRAKHLQFGEKPTIIKRGSTTRQRAVSKLRSRGSFNDTRKK